MSEQRTSTEGETPPPSDSEPSTPPGPQPPKDGSWLGRAFIAFLKSAAGLAVLATVPIFLVFGNTQLKELADNFLGGCAFVFEREVTKSQQLLVTAKIAGAMPKAIPLIFEGRQASINVVLFDDPYRLEQALEPDDLAFHPLTGSTCPGALCSQAGDDEFRPTAEIMLRDLRPEFTYRFMVRLKPENGELTEEHLKVYALFNAGLSDGVCRVQPRRWFNFWVWASPIQKAILFLSFVVAGGLLLQWARSSGSGDKS